jgi:hypothetical protein
MTMSNFDGRGVGMANALNTNTDTSARVHTTARTCLSLYNSLADPNLVASNKAAFRAQREEIALGIGRPFSPMGVSYEQRGLPAIVTNTAVFNTGKPEDFIRWMIRFYDCRNRRERVAHCATSCSVKGQAYFPSELYFAGIVISDGEADPMHGDTALTLMIGGKVTIKNGHYSIQTGDAVQWYFDEEQEAGRFDAEGLRVRRAATTSDQPIDYIMTPKSKEMKKVRDFAYAERALLKRPALIKPCLMGLDGRGATRADSLRCFAIACSNAGPWERCVAPPPSRLYIYFIRPPPPHTSPHSISLSNAHARACVCVCVAYTICVAEPAGWTSKSPDSRCDPPPPPQMAFNWHAQWARAKTIMHPLPPPYDDHGGDWGEAQHRWSQPGRLTSYEKVGAVLSAGQLLRISTVALMAFFQNSSALPPPQAASDGWRAGGEPPPPMALFHVSESQSDGVTTLHPAHEAKRIYAQCVPTRKKQ